MRQNGENKLWRWLTAGASNRWQSIFFPICKIFFRICKICFRICKYFSGFTDNSWIYKLVWDLQNNVCGFNNFSEICKGFSDLINSSTLISKKTLRFNFFPILEIFFQISLIFWDCPLSASVEKTTLWTGENKTKTVVWAKIFCFILVEKKTGSFKNSLVWSWSDVLCSLVRLRKPASQLPFPAEMLVTTQTEAAASPRSDSTLSAPHSTQNSPKPAR